MRGAAEAGQQYRGGDPQPGRDLGGRGARLHQFEDLLGQPAAHRTGRVAAVPLDGDQLGDALEQVEPGGRPLPGVRLDGQQPVGQDRLAHVPGGGGGAPARAADREERVRRPAGAQPVRAAPARPGGGQVLTGQGGGERGRERLARARDLAAGGGEDPGAEIQVGAEQVEDHLGSAAGRSRGHEAPVPVDDGRQVTGPLAGHLSNNVLGDRRERNGLVHREQRQPMA